jgi:ribosome-binding factor A
VDHRLERITEAIREELSEMIGYEMADPRVGSAIVTEVQISHD